MSAITGSLTLYVISFNAFVESSSGHETLTMSAPSSWIAFIWSIVALTTYVKATIDQINAIH